MFCIFVDLKNEINNVSDRFKDYLFVIITKKLKNEKRNKNDLKLLANDFYQRFIDYNINNAINIYQIDMNKFFENIV